MQTERSDFVGKEGLSARRLKPALWLISRPQAAEASMTPTKTTTGAKSPCSIEIIYASLKGRSSTEI